MVTSLASDYLDVDEDRVVLLDEVGLPCGSASRSLVHSARTPLHLAFSCYLVGPDGRMLVTRRALTKRTWPGVWTNAFCGHPRPGEPMAHAIRRHARSELGITVRGVELVLPQFRYRATDAAGVVENEVCPVYLATTRQEPHPDPDEVLAYEWVEPEALGRAVRSAPWAFSPWLVGQVEELAALDPEPLGEAG
jgi:isopentenyl-diphosphate Delta-isomerase